MKRFFASVIAAVCVVALSGPAIAGGVTLNADGFYASGAFFFREGSNIPYTREARWTWVPGTAACLNCGRYVAATAGYYSFAGYNYVAVSVDPNRSDARQLLLAMARDAKAADNFRLARSQEHKETLELANALGLGGVLTPSFVSYPALNGTLQLSSAGTQGATVLGYQTYQSTTQSYAPQPVDLNVMYQQMLRLTEQLQTNAAAAHADSVDLTKLAGQEQARIAQIYAQRDALVALASAIRPDSSSKTTTTIQTPIQANPQPIAAADFVRLSGPAKCVKCHTGAGPKGGFDVSTVPTLKDKSKVMERLLSTDPKIVMPPPSENAVLSAAEILQFFQPKQALAKEVVGPMPPAK